MFKPSERGGFSLVKKEKPHLPSLLNNSPLWVKLSLLRHPTFCLSAWQLDPISLGLTEAEPGSIRAEREVPRPLATYLTSPLVPMKEITGDMQHWSCWNSRSAAWAKLSHIGTVVPFPIPVLGPHTKAYHIRHEPFWGPGQERPTRFLGLHTHTCACACTHTHTCPTTFPSDRWYQTWLSLLLHWDSEIGFFFLATTESCVLKNANCKSISTS